MTRRCTARPRRCSPRIAPTEIDPRRGGLVRGKVHDERAYYLGGVSAHAGLFSSAHDMARFARMYLNGGTLDGVRVFQPATIALFTAYADSAFSNRALGWQKPICRECATQSVGGMGWTSCRPPRSAIRDSRARRSAMDPASDVFVILLSNRVNPRATTRRSRRARRARRRRDDARSRRRWPNASRQSP